MNDDKIKFANLVKHNEYDADMAKHYGRKRVKNKKQITKQERKYKHKLYDQED